MLLFELKIIFIKCFLYKINKVMCFLLIPRDVGIIRTRCLFVIILFVL